MGQLIVVVSSYLDVVFGHIDADDRLTAGVERTDSRVIVAFLRRPWCRNLHFFHGQRTGPV